MSKGTDWEATVAKALRDAGLAQARKIGSGAGKHGDVHCAPLLVECKNEAHPPRLRAAFDQAKGDLVHHRDCSIPAAVCKTIGDRKGTLLVMRFDDWLERERVSLEQGRQVALLQTEVQSLRHELERARTAMAALNVKIDVFGAGPQPGSSARADARLTRALGDASDDPMDYAGHPLAGEPL